MTQEPRRASPGSAWLNGKTLSSASLSMRNSVSPVCRVALSSERSNWDRAPTSDAPFRVVFSGWERHPVTPQTEWKVTMSYHWTPAHSLVKFARNRNRNPPDGRFHPRYLYSERRESIFSKEKKKKKNLPNLTNERKLNNGADGDVYLTGASWRFGTEERLQIPVPQQARFYFYLSGRSDTVHD